MAGWLCEVLRSKMEGHCKGTGTAVAFNARDPRIRVIICDEHGSRMYGSWARLSVDRYAVRYNLVQDEPIIGGRK